MSRARAPFGTSRLWEGLNVDPDEPRALGDSRARSTTLKGSARFSSRVPIPTGPSYALVYDLAHFVPHSGHTYAVASRTSSKFTAREHAAGVRMLRPCRESRSSLLARIFCLAQPCRRGESDEGARGDHESRWIDGPIES